MVRWRAIVVLSARAACACTLTCGMSWEKARSMISRAAASSNSAAMTLGLLRDASWIASCSFLTGTLIGCGSTSWSGISPTYWR